jgi:cytochrome d ubiquinol oxidase subunit I
MFDLDPILLARIQFAFTISFHIVFPAFTIGLASFLAVLEWRWLKTGNDLYRDVYKFWVKIFAVAFGMGVVSGVVMSYQFGTNWSIFSDRVANVLGPLLGFEVLTAFFLEASFLGIMLFGWGRVSKRMHFVATCIVAGGTLMSAFWILSANSWMQTPQGFTIAEDGRLMPANWLEIIFNPSFPYRFAHMVTAAYLTTAFVVGGVGAFYLWNKRHVPQARIMLGMAAIMAALVAPTQLFIGHMHGANTMEHQPAKVAAMEGNWEHTTNAPLYLFGWPNQKEERTDYGITIPNGASWVLTGSADGAIPNLKSFKPEDRPPVAPVFWSFRVMVGLGMLMILIGAVSAVQYFRGKLFTSRWLHGWWMLMMPSGFVALLAGWFVTEIGRQPWTAYGIIRTIHSVSPAILGPQVAWSLLAFVVMYIFVFGAGSYYILKLIGKGIPAANDKEQFYRHSIEATVTEAATSENSRHV